MFPIAPTVFAKAPFGYLLLIVVLLFVGKCNLLKRSTMVTGAIYKTAISQTFHKCRINCCLKYSRDIGRRICCTRPFSDHIHSSSNKTSNNIGDKNYAVDSWTNVTPKILSYRDRNLHNQKYHPLQLIKQRIVNYIYSYYPGRKAPLFSVYDKVRIQFDLLG